MAETIACEAKHTPYDPPTSEFKCPKCGATPDSEPGGFYNDETAEGANEACDKMHDEDVLRCFNRSCGWSGTGKAFAARLAAKKNLMTCPCCKGKGTVPKK